MKISNSRAAKNTDMTRAEDAEQTRSDQTRKAKQRSDCSNSFKIKYILIKNYN